MLFGIDKNLAISCEQLMHAVLLHIVVADGVPAAAFATPLLHRDVMLVLGTPATRLANAKASTGFGKLPRTSHQVIG